MKRREFLQNTSRMGVVATLGGLGSGYPHAREAASDPGSDRPSAAGSVAVDDEPKQGAGRSALDVYRAYLLRDELVSGGMISANWTSDGGFWFADGSPENTTIMRVDLETGKASPLFDVRSVRSALAAATGHEPPYRGLPFDHFTQAEDGYVEFSYDDGLWRLERSTGRVERKRRDDPWSQKLGAVPKAARHNALTWKRSSYLTDKLDVPEQLSPDDDWFASVQNYDVVLRSTGDGRRQKLTHCGTPDIFWDIEPASVWSADSLTLLAYRRDVTGVFRMPRVNCLKRFEDVDFITYQKAGARIDRVTPVFIDVRSGKQTPVSLGEVENRYIVVTDWHQEEAIITVYSRDLKRVDVLVAGREGGATRILLTESAATFQVNHVGAAVSRSNRFRKLPGDGGFLWLSSRDGWNHIYHYSWKGQLIRQVTSGHWPVYEIEVVGADGFVYFTGAVDEERPYDVHVCRVHLHGGKIQRLTRARGIHTPLFAPGGQAFLDTHSAVDRPVQTDLIRSDGQSFATVSRMDIARLKAIGYTPAEEFTVIAADGVTALWGVLYRPFDFDSARRYPVIECIYGGPQTIAAQRFFAVGEELRAYHRHLPWALAQLGYIVVCLDARGTPGRSKAFQDFVYGNWSAGLEDHAHAIRQLCERHSWMDINRVGITGHSFGGYFATCALIQAPDVYRAAVASAPGPDPWDMIIWEPYLDLPQHDRARYDRADLTRQSDKVKGQLMLVVGTADFANINTTFRMSRALIEARINHELVVVPGAVHAYAEGPELDYFLMKLVDWFDRHVKSRVS